MQDQRSERLRRIEMAKKLKIAEKEARKHAIKNRPQFKGLQIRPTVSLFDESDRIEPGENNWKGWGFDIHPQVTIASSIILFLFISFTLLFPVKAENLFSGILESLTVNLGWFLITIANVIIVAALFFAFGKYGNLKIGGSEAQPEFSRFAWFAMLLSAGMGIGLLFWSVAEPITHLGNPSPMFGNIAAQSPEAAQAAMTTTFFHWGLHPWAIYAIVGLALAFFAYNEGLPLTIRSVFYPIIGNKIYGFWGNFIDVMSVLATLIGLATSLGFGVTQVNAGLNYLFGINISTTVQIILIIVITLFATTSVVLGLDGGVKKLSEINMILAGVFLVFIIIAGPTVYIFSGFTQNLGNYLSNIIEMSLWTETFKGTNWQGNWTVFYWAWWISWSPFVGMFIARISKGRTVRDFILSVMIIPTILSFVWMSTFGGTAIYQQTNGISDLVPIVNEDVSLALFAMLQGLPWTSILSVVGIILVTVFFVTSSDSGSLVVDHLISGGKLDSPVPQRIFWALMEGVVAITLLVGGGLSTIQTAAVITGLPFAIVILLMIYSLNVGLKQEYEVEEIVKKEMIHVRHEYMINDVIEQVVHDEAIINAEDRK